LIAKNELLNNDKLLARSLIRATLKGHLFYGQKAEETLNIIQKVLRIDDRKAARETYEDEMRRYNPGGQFEQSNMRKVIDRVRDTRKMERKVDTQEVFDLRLGCRGRCGAQKSWLETVIKPGARENSRSKFKVPDSKCRTRCSTLNIELLNLEPDCGGCP